MSDVACQNCGTEHPDDRVRLLSFDLDLPPVRLCGICSYAIVCDRELFDEIAGRR